jgi:hypothetical protein
MEVPCAGEKGRGYILGHFYITFNWKVGRKSTLSCHSLAPFALGPRGGTGQTQAYTYANSQVPPSTREEEVSILCNLRKDL